MRILKPYQLQPAGRGRCVDLVHAAAMLTRPASFRKPYQDYSSWQSYGTGAFWKNIKDNPVLAGELIAQRLSTKLGLKSPSEVCSADVTAGILVCIHGPGAGALCDVATVHRHFEWFKARPCMHAPLHPCMCTGVCGDHRNGGSWCIYIHITTQR